MFENDTIAAVSTPQGTGGVSIIRISGADSFNIAKKIFKGTKNFMDMKSHTISHGFIIDTKTGEIADEVLVSKMAKPNSFTGEDTVEINCHGGIVVTGRVLTIVLKEGARAAAPGEFTKRAFINGKVDLTKAEAVIDVINAKTEESARCAVTHLEGRLSLKLGEIRNKLVTLIAHIEVTVDYPEHDIEELTSKEVYDEIKSIKKDLLNLLSSFERGRILRDGMNVVIAGRPNVGKSSLMNWFSGRNRAIVTDIPGTTRDILEEYINIDGIPVRLVDTAGIRETTDTVEKIGVTKASDEISSSDLVIFMVDAKEGILQEDMALYKDILSKGKKTLIVANKMDSVKNKALIDEKFPGRKVFKISLIENTGTENILDEVKSLFSKGQLSYDNDLLVTSVRHKDLIEKSVKSIDDAASAFEAGMPPDFMTIDIKNAAHFLGEITGESITEEVINEIFQKFCVGK